MNFDLELCADKLRRYRKQLQVSLVELSESTGISVELLSDYENAKKQPTGDEILILADFFKCEDYMFFLSNKRLAPFEETETLFRKHSNEFSKEDRWGIQEFLFLCACESFLLRELKYPFLRTFGFTKMSHIHKTNGQDAAARLRLFLKHPENMVPENVYDDFRKIGIHTFRRKLQNSNISGLCIKHPVAGKCILINYSEDVYRQRFTAAHEAAHAILDDQENDDVIVSFTKQKASCDYKEVGANTFASHYLLPASILKCIPEPNSWDPPKIKYWSNKLRVSTQVLAYALYRDKLIDNRTVSAITSTKVSKEVKIDPELSSDLSPHSLVRKRELLKRGLSSFYVERCFDALHRGAISRSRMAEMLLTDESGLYEIANLYKVGQF